VVMLKEADADFVAKGQINAERAIFNGQEMTKAAALVMEAKLEATLLKQNPLKYAKAPVQKVATVTPHAEEAQEEIDPETGMPMG
jgi:hypothetical protein